MSYKAHNKRYEKISYRRCGDSGLKLPSITLGLWHNFGGKKMPTESKKMIFRAFDKGVTHFDLANNYGPPYGSAESNFGKLISSNLKSYRDELLISTKAGYDMWPGPYGEWGSKKYITASLDQSLERLQLEYVDIFYSHRFDPLTPLEETADALAQAVHHGKALYAGISSYSAKKTIIMNKLLKERGIKCLIHQPSYSMINRWIEKDLLQTLNKLGITISPPTIFCVNPLSSSSISNSNICGFFWSNFIPPCPSFFIDLYSINLFIVLKSSLISSLTIFSSTSIRASVLSGDIPSIKYFTSFINNSFFTGVSCPSIPGLGDEV